MGPSSAAIACWGLYVGLARRNLRNSLALATILALTLNLVLTYQGYAADHFVAFIFGLLVGILLVWIKSAPAARGAR